MKLSTKNDAKALSKLWIGVAAIGLFITALHDYGEKECGFTKSLIHGACHDPQTKTIAPSVQAPLPR